MQLCVFLLHPALGCTSCTSDFPISNQVCAFGRYTHIRACINTQVDRLAQVYNLSERAKDETLGIAMSPRIFGVSSLKLHMFKTSTHCELIYISGKAFEFKRNCGHAQDMLFYSVLLNSTDPGCRIPLKTLNVFCARKCVIPT